MTDQDPSPDRRVYYTHAQTGDRGYLVKRYGSDHIKYDRVGPDQTIPFRPQDWREDVARRPLQEHEMAQIAYEADRRLCRALGKVREANRQWIDLPDAERIRFVQSGPAVPRADLRMWLYRAIITVLKSHGAEASKTAT